MSIFRRSSYFLNTSEIEQVMQEIRQQELATSGEIRLYIERHCSLMNPLAKAAELFHSLRMFETANRNAVLIYIAYEDHDFALYGDKDIIQLTDPNFWSNTSRQLAVSFNNKQYLQGILLCIETIGQQLKTHFPWEGEKKNELPDDIIFGK
jgi:uncharacterized membrane protein